MSATGNAATLVDQAVRVDSSTDARRRKELLKAGALQNAILTSANFSIIATDEKGIIRLFNLGAERMLGYMAAEVVNKIRPSDIHDRQERTVIPTCRGRAQAGVSGGRAGTGKGVGGSASWRLTVAWRDDGRLSVPVLAEAGKA